MRGPRQVCDLALGLRKPEGAGLRQIKQTLAPTGFRVRTHPMEKVVRSFGMENPCTHGQFSVKILTNIYDVLSVC